MKFQTLVVAKKGQRRSMSSDDSKGIMVKKTVDISYPEDHDDMKATSAGSIAVITNRFESCQTNILTTEVLLYRNDI